MILCVLNVVSNYYVGLIKHPWCLKIYCHVYCFTLLFVLCNVMPRYCMFKHQFGGTIKTIQQDDFAFCC